jgi:virginiamycin B lyase
MRHVGSVEKRLAAGARPARGFRPGGAETGLEERTLLSVQVATFPAPAVAVSSQDLTKGPDGNLWFTEPGVGKVGRMTPQGAVTEFPLPAGHDATGAITTGPDGNLWFTEDGGLGRITTGGVVTEFVLAPGSHPTGITKGPDGNLWFLDTGRQAVDRMTPAGVLTEFPVPSVVAQRTLSSRNLFHDITAGPGGDIWFTGEQINPRTHTEIGEIGRVTTAGKVTLYRLSSGPVARHHSAHGKAKPTTGVLADAITAGPDGNVWFTEHAADGPAAVGRITPDGTITSYVIPATPAGATAPDISTAITAGPDGNLWFNLADDDFLNGPNPGPYVGRITPQGVVSVEELPVAKDADGGLLADGIESIVAGPNHQLWFTSGTRRLGSPTGRVIATITPPKK